ncbi:hypothetical protein KR059_006999 [Drosophila kikkawai]|nr:hypothetical protein KR059_006999 [Drosophila kikkawai]
MSSHCDIINLPIEILDMVYKYIPDMRDKLNLAKSHCVLGKAFAFHAGNTFKEIVIERQTIEDWSAILSLCGSSVTSITAEDIKYTVSAAKLAFMHCPNLEKFSFSVCSSSWNQIKSLFLTLQNLSDIEIWNYGSEYLSGSGYVCVVDTLLLMPKLKHFKLSDNYPDLERFGELLNLTKLAIVNSIEPIDFFRVIRSLKNIDSLELHSAVVRMPKDLGDEQLLPKIELLKLSYATFRTPLPYLPSLKHLTVSYGFENGKISDVFGESVFSYGKTLESLDISRIIVSFIKNDTIGVIMNLKALKKLDFRVGYKDCLYDLRQLENLEVLNLHLSNITNRGAIMVIKGCKKLRHLNIRKCDQVNSDMVKEAVTALQNSPPRSDKPFVLIVGPDFGKVDKVS